MKEKHIEFLIRFHKPTSRQLNLLSDGGVSSNSDLERSKVWILKNHLFQSLRIGKILVEERAEASTGIFTFSQA